MEYAKEQYSVGQVARPNEDKPPVIYSSYFGNAKRLQKDGIVMICIAQFAPRYITGIVKFTKLAPDAHMLKGLKAGTITHEQFRKAFDAKLEKLDAQAVWDELAELGDGSSVAIMCYEKPPDTCHRHKVVHWFKEKLGLIIEEYPFK